MVVKKPLNINDETVVDGMSHIEKPSSQPTSMSYSLQRIRLFEISRNIVDRTPLIMALGDLPDYDIVMDIDTELQVFLNEIPPFFSMPTAKLVETYQLNPLQAANIFYQGYTLRSIFYAQRCKLHLAYFTRGFVDSTYVFSREICLQSARCIVQNESKPERPDLRSAARYKFLGFLILVFIASIVLLVDLCHKKSSPHHEKQRGEIAVAFRILEEARYESETAAKFLDSLILVLRKHHLSPPNGIEQLTSVSGESLVENVVPPISSTNMLGSNEVTDTNMTGDTFPNGEDMSSYFNVLAESFEQGIDVGSFDWNGIFSGLDSSFI
jgi:hypothetical protein